MNAPRRTLRALVAIATAAGALAQAPDSAAQTPIPMSNGAGFDLRLFRPAVDSKGQFTVNGTDILGAGDLAFGLIADVGVGMMHAGNGGANLVNYGFSGVLAANVGIANVLELGAQIPIHLFSGPGSSDAALQGVDRSQYQPPASGLNFGGVGDIALHAKLRWLRAEYYPVGLAIILQGGWGPMGGSRSFVGEPGGFVAPSAAVEVRPSRRVRLDFNLGARIPFAAGSTFAGSTYGPSITWGAGISWRAAQVLDLVAETYGALYLTGFGNIVGSMPWEAVGGAKIFVERNSYLMLGAGRGIVPGAHAAADFRAFLGFVYEPTIGDTDGDGYRDDVDQCINDPEDFDGFQDDDGCSERDNDRDGILDVDDQCPLIPEDRDGDHDNDGCPEGQEADRDGDGILDGVDRCADDPEDRDNFEDVDGCPEPDNDRDQILDTNDNCPNEPEDRDNFEDDDGCPDPDNDRDGILDERDRNGAVDCRNDPENFNGVEDDDGCPDSGDLIRVGNEIRLREQIQFETDSAEIRPVSFPILDQMANLLRQNDNFELVEVEGHTDVRANDEHNLRLSRDRANAVMQALIQRGIAPNRLVAAGYGEYCPLDPRNNPRAWERNRRVQFLIVRTRDEGRTTAAAGCPRAAQYIPPEVGPPGTGVARERVPGQDQNRSAPSRGSAPAPSSTNAPAANGSAPAPSVSAPSSGSAAPAAPSSAPGAPASSAH